VKAALLAIVACAGCASYGSMTSARTIAPGTSQASTALETDGVGIVENPVRLPLPTLAIGVRRGLREDLDVGGKLSILPIGDALTALGLEAQVRWRFLGDPSRRWELAVAPSTGWRGTESSGARWDAGHVVLPLVIGLNFGSADRRHQLYWAPKAGWQRLWSAGAMPVDVPFAGSTLGFAWRLRERLSLVPEATLLRSPTSLDQSDGSAIVHVGVGLVFGAP
jgi:hypothetical protein